MNGSLSPEQIKALLSLPAKTRGKKKVEIDTNVRDLQTWFKLRPSSFTDDSLQTHAKCDNPNCSDDRPPRVTSTGKEVKVQACIQLKGLYCCRRCFISGWLLDDPNQAQIEIAT
jgi:hypothetical protein